MLLAKLTMSSAFFSSTTIALVNFMIWIILLVQFFVFWLQIIISLNMSWFQVMLSGVSWSENWLLAKAAWL